VVVVNQKEEIRGGDSDQSADANASTRMSEAFDGSVVSVLPFFLLAKGGVEQVHPLPLQARCPTWLLPLPVTGLPFFQRAPASTGHRAHWVQSGCERERFGWSSVTANNLSGHVSINTQGIVSEPRPLRDLITPLLCGRSDRSLPKISKAVIAASSSRIQVDWT
jgi:hypothetical protein